MVGPWGHRVSDGTTAGPSFAAGQAEEEVGVAQDRLLPLALGKKEGEGDRLGFETFESKGQSWSFPAAK